MRAMAPIRIPQLSDGTVRLRALEERDVGAIVEAARDPEIVRWTTAPAGYTREDARRFMAVAATTAAAGAAVAFAIADAADRLVGTAGLSEIDPARGSGEVGYWLAAGARGRGTATRAVVLLRDWAHAGLGLTELVILSHRDNRPSAAVAERAGFADTGATARAVRMPPGRRDGYRRFVWRAETRTVSPRGSGGSAG